MQIYTERKLSEIKQLQHIDKQTFFDMQVVASVLPFRINSYVINNLIDWDNIEDDPIYNLTFPQKGMLAREDFTEVANILSQDNVNNKELFKVVTKIRKKLNPHPAGQKTLNVPFFNGKFVEGIQHKYKETVLFFSKPRSNLPYILYVLFSLGAIYWR